jgi:transcriptional regulator GlxA family with amidase domain
MTTQALTVTIIGSPYSSSSGMFVFMDVLTSVGRDWSLLTGEGIQSPRFVPTVKSLDGEPFTAPNGMVHIPHGPLIFGDYPDIVLIPDQYIAPSGPFPNEFAAIGDWIKAAYANGSIVASVCSGTMLLAHTGLLSGLEATTHWGFCDSMGQLFPDIKVRRERLLVPAGDGHRLITAGGPSSWHDVVLYLIARLAGIDEARKIARLYLLNWHEYGQLPYACLSISRQHDDLSIRKAQVWAADNYAHPAPVREMARHCGLNERSFLRRFQKATGQSPLDYIRHLRLEEAKQMLETSDQAPDDIAAEVGYEEPAAFRALFKKAVGMTPLAYRRRHRLPAISIPI